MEGLNPISRLRQGYSFVADSGRHAVRSVKQVKKGDRLTIYVTDGTVTAGVKETAEVETYHE
jgi:exodeoxyribonuclease VII large subunit